MPHKFSYRLCLYHTRTILCITYCNHRLIFNATLDTFPGAFITLTAGLMLASAFAYFYLFTQQKTIAMAVKEQEQDEEADTKF